MRAPSTNLFSDKAFEMIWLCICFKLWQCQAVLQCLKKYSWIWACSCLNPNASSIKTMHFRGLSSSSIGKPTLELQSTGNMVGHSSCWVEEMDGLILPFSHQVQAFNERDALYDSVAPNLSYYSCMHIYYLLYGVISTYTIVSLSTLIELWDDCPNSQLFCKLSNICTCNTKL